MNIHLKHLVLFAAPLLIFCKVGLAQQGASDVLVDETETERYIFPVDPLKDFYDQSKQGYYSFEDPTKIDKPEDVDPELPTGSPAGPPPFSTKWFRANMQDIRDKAIDDPTAENVRVYMIVQRVMMDKAEKFAEMGHNITFGDPLLDENLRRASSTPGRTHIDRQARQAREALLSKIGPNSGIYFFTQPNCPPCDVQEVYVNELAIKYGFTVVVVSLDGRELNREKYLINQGQAESMGVTIAPSVAYYNTNNYIRTLTQGMVDHNVLRKRILVAATEGKLLSPSEYAQSKNINPTDNLAEMLKGTPVDPLTDPDAFLSQFSGYRTRAFIQDDTSVIGKSQ